MFLSPFTLLRYPWLPWISRSLARWSAVLSGGCSPTAYWTCPQRLYLLLWINYLRGLELPSPPQQGLPRASRVQAVL